MWKLRLFICAVMPNVLPALKLPFMLGGPPARIMALVLVLVRPAGSSLIIICTSCPLGSRMLYCAIVRIFLVTHPARILPRCFSANRERWKSPLITKATMSMTSWCSFRMAFTITGTMEARKLRRKISTTTTTRPPAWNTALQCVSHRYVRSVTSKEAELTILPAQCYGGSALPIAQCPLRSDLAH